MRKFIEQASINHSSSDENEYDSDRDPAWTPDPSASRFSQSFSSRPSVTGPSITGPPPYKRKFLFQTSRQPSTPQEPRPSTSSAQLDSTQHDPRPSTLSAQLDESDFDSPDDNADDSEEDAGDINLQQIVNNLVLEEEREENVDDEFEVVVVNNRQIWNEYRGNHKEFAFTGNSGMQQELDPEITPFQVFSRIVDDEVIALIVKETNRYALQCIQKGDKKFMGKWKPTNADEIRKFLMLIVWMGLVPIGSIKNYWATKSVVYNFDFPKHMMSRDRFFSLLSCLHFSDNDNNQADDRLGKIRNFMTLMQRKFQDIFIPGEEIVIDESLVPFRGRLLFRQYIPNKAHKYGIKLFKLCSNEGFTYALKVYSGKSSTGVREVGLAQNVCLELCQNLLGQGRTLYVDNFYTSYELAKDLLEKTHTPGRYTASQQEKCTLRRTWSKT